jgi:putative transposase
MPVNLTPVQRQITKAIDDFEQSYHQHFFAVRALASPYLAAGPLERIANELLLKLGLRVSPRTVRKYLPGPAPRRPRGDQRWSAFLKNHAQAIVACDFFVAVTSTFRVLYVLVIIEHHSRRLIHYNVTAHPSAQWTRQQLRDAIGYERRYEYLIHDRDSIFSTDLDESIQRLGLRVLKSPPRSPTANSICERVIGTIRRECLDWLIPLSEAHVRKCSNFGSTITQSRPPHMAFGPGCSGPASESGRSIVEVAAPT